MYKREKFISALQEAASTYLAQTRTSKDLVTVTSIRPSKNLTRAEICVTVYPEEKEQSTITTLNKERGAFAEYVKAHTRLSSVPFLSFTIDGGEKHRQRIDSLSQSS